MRVEKFLLVLLVVALFTAVFMMLGIGNEDRVEPYSWSVDYEAEKTVEEASLKHLGVEIEYQMVPGGEQGVPEALRLTAEEINNKEGDQSLFSKYDIVAIEFVSEGELDGLAIVVNSKQGAKQLYSSPDCSKAERVVNGRVVRGSCIDGSYDVEEPKIWTEQDLEDMGYSPEESIFPTNELFRE